MCFSQLMKQMKSETLIPRKLYFFIYMIDINFMSEVYFLLFYGLSYFHENIFFYLKRIEFHLCNISILAKILCFVTKARIKK